MWQTGGVRATGKVEVCHTENNWVLVEANDRARVRSLIRHIKNFLRSRKQSSCYAFIEKDESLFLNLTISNYFVSKIFPT